MPFAAVIAADRAICISRCSTVYLKKRKKLFCLCTEYVVQGGAAGCNTGKGEKPSYSQESSNQSSCLSVA